MSMSLLVLSLLFSHSVLCATVTPAADIASQYALTVSTSLPFPTNTLDANQSATFIKSSWSLSKARIQNGESNLVFVQDPFPEAAVPGTSSPTNASVLQVAYPAGSFSNGGGGSQFVNLWNASASTTHFQSMLLTYELAFDSNFPWVKGGKLPGLRGGPNITGCDGGKEPTGSDCFSARLMWRTNAAGEAYIYVPTTDGICKDKAVICNSDFGVSLHRGAFGFSTGQWARISLLVQMNNPPTASNGFLAVYFNDLLVISQQSIQYRTSSTVDIGGLFFSTFFGGNDASWATPVDTHTYFRNVQLFGSANASTMASASRRTHSSAWGWVVFVAIIVFFCGIELI